MTGDLLTRARELVEAYARERNDTDLMDLPLAERLADERTPGYTDRGAAVVWFLGCAERFVKEMEATR